MAIDLERAPRIIVKIFFILFKKTIVIKVIYGNLTSVAQDLLHYFDNRGRATLITTLRLNLTIKKQPSSKQLRYKGFVI